jgi:hypothetical protein
LLFWELLAGRESQLAGRKAGRDAGCITAIL